MRNIKYIVIHCTATPQHTTVQSMINYWRNVMGWKNPGYHRVVKADGGVETLLPDEQVSNGVAGYNSQCINISYIGGIDAAGKPKDTRTPAQKETILRLLQEYKTKYPNAVIQGHRDFPRVKKACPSFDAKTEYKNIGN